MHRHLLIALTAVFMVATVRAQDAATSRASLNLREQSSFVPVAGSSGHAALFVGVNEFIEDTSVSPLRFAVNDAVATAHLFILELKLFAPDHAVLAISGSATGEAARQLDELKAAHVTIVVASKAKIFVQLQRMTALPQAESDLLMVQIASHGFEQKGVAYVLGTDGVSTVQDTTLSVTSIENLMAESKAAKRVLLLDACRNKPLVNARGGPEPMSKAFRDALASAAGQAVLASCDVGQVSWEDPNLEHGIFTHFLLKGLRGAAMPDGAGLIRLDSVKQYVANSVEEWSKQHGKSPIQKPWSQGPEASWQIPLAVDPRGRELMEKRIKKLRELALDKKLSVAEFGEAESLLRTDPADEVQRKRLAAFEKLADGKMDVESTRMVLESIASRVESPPASKPKLEYSDQLDGYYDSMPSFDQVVRELSAAISTAKAAVDAHPNVRSSILALARYRIALGRQLGYEHGVGQDTENFDAALSDLEKLAGATSTDDEVKLEIARACWLRSGCYAKVELGRADCTRARDLATALRGKNSQKAEVLRVLSGAIGALARIEDEKDRRDEALRLLNEAVAICESGDSPGTDSPYLKRSWCFTLSCRADLLKRMGRGADARRDWDEAIRIGRQLAQANEHNICFRTTVAELFEDYARFLWSTDEIDAGHRASEESCAIWEDLIRDTEARPSIGTALIAIRNETANARNMIPPGDTQRDDVAYFAARDAAMQTARRMCAKYPRDPGVAYEACMALAMRAGVDEESGRDESALSYYVEGLETYARTAKATDRDRAEVRTPGFLGVAVSAIDAAVRLRKSDRALRIAELARMVGNNCTDREGIHSLMSVLISKGFALSQTNRTREAIDTYVEALRLARPAFEQAPWHWFMRNSFQIAYWQLASLYQETGELDREVRARQEWMHVWGKPMQSLNSQGLIDPDPPPSVALAERLRAAMSLDATQVKHVAIPVDYGGARMPFQIALTNVAWPKDPLEDQARWLKEVRGGIIPDKVRQDFRQFNQRAHENHESFVDLCVQELSTPQSPSAPRPGGSDRRD